MLTGERHGGNQGKIGLVIGLTRPAGLALRDIKLLHSVFALPFALLGAFLATPAATASPGPRPAHAWRTFAAQVALVVLCMVFARTWAMLVNRLADRRFDAANPRTARRAFAAGAVSSKQGWALAIFSAALFALCCAGFLLFFANPWPIALALPTLGWIALYSYTKRFTALSHLFLGSSLALSPLAAAIAVQPATLASIPALWPIAGMVLFWVAGFDVLYALQDQAFDRETGLRSIPAALGPRRAALVSRALHAIALGLLLLAGALDPRLRALFGVACALAGALLIAEHIYLSRTGLKGLPVSFGLVNGMISLVLGGLGIADILLHTGA